MKKIIAALVVILALIAGVFFATKDAKSGVAKTINDGITKTVDGAVGKSAGAAIEQQIAEFIARNDIFETTSAKFYPGDSNSSGFIEGVVKKEKLRAYLTDGVKKIKGLADREDVNETLDFNPQEAFPQDFAFRYDYAVKHSVKDVADGFEMNGTIKVQTPYYAEPIKEFFKTDTPVSTHVLFGPTERKFEAKLADIDLSNDGDIVRIAGFSLGGTSDMSGDIIKGLNFKLPELYMNDDESIAIGLKGFGYDATFINGVAKSSDLLKFVMSDVDYKASVEELVVIADKRRFIVATNLSSQGKNRVKDGILSSKDESKIETLKIADVLLRNIHSDMGVSLSAKLYEKFAFAKPDDLEALKRDTTLLKDLLKDDVKLDINDFSFENSLSKKFSLNSNVLVGGFIDEEKLFERMGFSGKIKINTTIADFLSPYDSLRDLGPMVEAYADQFVKKDGNGVKMEFRYDKASNSFDLNGKLIPLPSKF